MTAQIFQIRDFWREEKLVEWKERAVKRALARAANETMGQVEGVTRPKTILSTLGAPYGGKGIDGMDLGKDPA